MFFSIFCFFPSAGRTHLPHEKTTWKLHTSHAGAVPALGADSFTTVVFLVVYLNHADAGIPLALPVQLLLNSLNTGSIPAIHISATIFRATCGSPWSCRLNSIKANTVGSQQGNKLKQKPQHRLRGISEFLIIRDIRVLRRGGRAKENSQNTAAAFSSCQLHQSALGQNRKMPTSGNAG